jgi:hypothetical protein
MQVQADDISLRAQDIDQLWLGAFVGQILLNKKPCQTRWDSDAGSPDTLWLACRSFEILLEMSRPHSTF